MPLGSKTMNDIQTHDDVALLISTFYGKVVKDATIAHFFKHIDFDRHLPRMIHFWTFVLLDEPGYTTDVTAIHRNMPLEEKDFDAWIRLFNETTDELFSGEKAELAKQRAALIRWTLASKISGQK